MNQIGCVLVFKSGVDPNEIIKRLQAIADVAEPLDYAPDPNAKNVVANRHGEAVVELRKFNPDHGFPAWYIP